jgi:MEMO1 family protein
LTTEEQTTGFPRIRPVEAIPFSQDGERRICLRDPLGICEEMLFINEFTLFILSHFDGKHSILDIQADITRRTNEIIPSSQIQELIQQLDDALLMDTDRFRAHFDALKRTYAEEPVRMPSHSGVSYEADPAALRRHLDTLFEQAAPAPPNGVVRGIVAPHIDVKVGGPAFAKAFAHLRNSDAELFIILGTAHAFSENLFTVVPKDFLTPIGTMPVDRDEIETLRIRCGDRVFKEQFNHRNEHSIEFQAVFLRHALGPDHPATILPVLCSSFDALLSGNTDPAQNEEIAAMITALREIAATRKTCFIAGVDFAHVGLRFSDPEPPSVATLKEIERRDRQLVDIMARLDGPAFFAHFREDGDKRRVCGMSPLAVFLHAIDAARGELAAYNQMLDQDTGSVVSYASMVFYA